MKYKNTALISMNIVSLSLLIACSPSNISQSVDISGSYPQIPVNSQPSSAPVASPTPSSNQSPVPQPVMSTSPQPNNTPSPVASTAPSPSPTPDSIPVPQESETPTNPEPVNSSSPPPQPEQTPIPLSELEMTFVNIPAGNFQMGQAPLQPRVSEPIHPVTLSAFQMQTTEVTQKQWYTIMGSWPGGESPNKNFGMGDNYPVYYISWNDTQEFIQRMNQRGDGTYRLPTEAEWEYAARAGTRGDYPCGTQGSNGCPDLIAWVNNNRDSNPGSKPVGLKPRNPMGLYDMHGNVWEWAQDWYGTYNDSPITNPTGPNTGTFRIIRGGSWDNTAIYARSAYRAYQDPMQRRNTVGFRLVRTL